MPNARPTQPGYYWALIAVYGDTEQWQPVRLVDDGGLIVDVIGDDVYYMMADVDEWGPAIPEYRGEGGG